jgi:hypothetical protein
MVGIPRSGREVLTESVDDTLRDPWIRPPKPRVGTPALLIVHPQGHHESLDTRATTSAGRPPAER